MHLLLLRTRPTLPWITDFDMTPSKLDFAIDYLVEMVLFVGVSRPLIFVGPATWNDLLGEPGCIQLPNEMRHSVFQLNESL